MSILRLFITTSNITTTTSNQYRRICILTATQHLITNHTKHQEQHTTAAFDNINSPTPLRHHVGLLSNDLSNGQKGPYTVLKSTPIFQS
ncbi:hypothetical protein B9J09_02470 [Xylella fastidiosa subsp. pauca]|nr:hypothetical protein B9J09_02470 [Xylella fastidiosa subsp. pauca]TNW22881.1 hypothetical protein EIP73_08295 [Xylella fastidiosa subsp. pauca]TNW26873.1 hypothetical protein EIP74_11915 [Xylella fastidiosa subsp. pauca]